MWENDSISNIQKVTFVEIIGKKRILPTALVLHCFPINSNSKLFLIGWEIGNALNRSNGFKRKTKKLTRVSPTNDNIGISNSLVWFFKLSAKQSNGLKMSPYPFEMAIEESKN